MKYNSFISTGVKIAVCDSDNHTEDRPGRAALRLYSCPRIRQPGREVMNTTDVDVIVYVQKTGKLKPLYIVWEDPRSGEKTKYKIEKITYHLELPPGNHTWHVMIQGQKRQLRYNGKNWQIGSDGYQ